MWSSASHDHLRQKTGRGEAAFLQHRRQRGDDRHGVEFAAFDILAPDQAPTQETRRFVVELFAHFLPNQTPRLRLGLDRERIDDLLHARQVLGQPGLFLTRGRWDLRAPWGLRRRHGLGGFSRRASFQQEFKLLGIHLFAACAEDALDEQVHLLFEERVLLPQLCVLLQQFLFAFGGHWGGMRGRFAELFHPRHTDIIQCFSCFSSSPIFPCRPIRGF